MLRDLQALTKYYEEQEETDRVKVINQKIKENKVSEVYKIFYNFIKDNKEELLKYFENNDQELSTPEEPKKPKEKTEDEILKEKLEAVVGTKIKDKGTIVFIAEFHKDEEGEYKMGPTADSLPAAGTFLKNVFDKLIADHVLMDTDISKEDKLFLLRYKKEGEEFNNETAENARIITEKEFLSLYEKSSPDIDTQEKDLEEQQVEKLDFIDEDGREFFIINTKKYGKILYYISAGKNTRGISPKGTPNPIIGITFYNLSRPIWYFKFSKKFGSGPEGITFEKNPQDSNTSDVDKEFKSYRDKVNQVMENKKKTVNNLKELENSIKGQYTGDSDEDNDNLVKELVFSVKFNRFLEKKGALRKDFMRGAKFPFWGIDDIDFGDFVVSKNISVLDAK